MQQGCSHEQAGHHCHDAAITFTSKALFVVDSSSSSTPQAAAQQPRPVIIASVQAAFLRQSAAVTEPMYNAILAQVQAWAAWVSLAARTPVMERPIMSMPLLLHELWLSQSDSNAEERAAAEDSVQHLPAEVRQAAKSRADHPNSLSDKLHSLMRSAAVDLATQCVDTTLVLDSLARLDSPAPGNRFSENLD